VDSALCPPEGQRVLSFGAVADAGKQTGGYERRKGKETKTGARPAKEEQGRKFHSLVGVSRGHSPEGLLRERERVVIDSPRE